MIKEELEKEAEKYTEQCYGWTNNDQATDVAIATYIVSAEPREKRIADLEKENAEAIELAKYRSNTILKLHDQLTKAKEIIREIIKYDIPTLDYEKAEQFLNGDGCPDCFCEDCTKEDCTVRKLGLVSTKEIEK